MLCSVHGVLGRIALDRLLLMLSCDARSVSSEIDIMIIVKVSIKMIFLKLFSFSDHK